MRPWIKETPQGCLLSLYIQPGSSKNEVSGEHGLRLKIKIKALPKEGEANEGLIEFLSGLLRIPKKDIFLISGEASRQKTVLIEASSEKVLSLLQL